MAQKNEEKPVLTVAEQLKHAIDNNLQEINPVEFGEIKFEIRNGSVYRVYVSTSVLVRGNKNEAK